jgi:hypothetical protein
MPRRTDHHRAPNEPLPPAARACLAAWTGPGVRTPQRDRVDALLARIERSETSARFVPDGSDESFRSAA